MIIKITKNLNHKIFVIIIIIYILSSLDKTSIINSNNEKSLFNLI